MPFFSSERRAPPARRLRRLRSSTKSGSRGGPPRNAAIAYQAAFKLAPKFLANIRAARRLFVDVGNWPMVLTLLDADIGAATRRGREQRCCTSAPIFEHRLSREADALLAYGQCLALEPHDLSLLVQLEYVYSGRLTSRPW